jgi:hypothetical protein
MAALRRGLTMVPVGEGLLIDGAPRRHLLKGRVLAPVLPVLPRLVSMLDGDHGHGRICQELGLDLAQLDEFLALLAECGLLEHVSLPRPGPGSGAPDHVAVFLSRTAAASHGHGSGAGLSAALAGSGALIVAPREIGQQIAADLSETGVGRVAAAECAHEVSLAALRAMSSCTFGIAAVFDGWHGGSGHEELAEAVSDWNGRGVPVLRFGCGASGLEVGPTFLAGHPACVECFRRGLRAMTWQAATDGDAARGLPGDPHAEGAVLAGLVTAQLLALLAGLTAPAPPRMLLRMTLPGCQAERFDVTPEAGCLRCGDGRSATIVAELAEGYEWLESSEPAELTGARAASVPIELQRRAVRLERNDRAYAPRIPLSDSQAGLGLAEAGGYLRQLAGWRPAAAPGDAGRLDPCDGELPSVQAYLLTNGGPGHQATLFRYNGLAHELTAVRAGQVPLARSLAGTDLDPALLSFAIVLVAAVGELRRRYGDFALRLSQLDIGAATAQLAAAAAADGRPVTFASTWSGNVGLLLELDSESEIVAAVAGIGRDQGEGTECR